MRHCLPALTAAAILLGPSFADGQAARPDEPPIVLREITCAEAAASQRVPFRFLPAAIAGDTAARAGSSLFSSRRIEALEEVLRTACAAEGAGSRRLADIVDSLPALSAPGDEIELTALTCAELPSVWRQGARRLVPFLVAQRNAADRQPLTRPALDQVGEMLPRLCREPSQAETKVQDIVAQLR